MILVSFEVFSAEGDFKLMAQKVTSIINLEKRYIVDLGIYSDRDKIFNYELVKVVMLKNGKMIAIISKRYKGEVESVDVLFYDESEFYREITSVIER